MFVTECMNRRTLLLNLSVIAITYVVSFHVIQGAELCKDWPKKSDPNTLSLITKKIQNLYSASPACSVECRLQSAININTANLQDLVRLPNIGPVTAVKIFRFRETYGLFKNVEDIKKVEGIGPAIFAGSKYYIKVR